MTSGPTIDSRASVTAAAHGAIFSVSVAGQEPELLAADGEQRPEHDDALVRALLEHRLESGGQGEHALAGAGVAAEADDADRRVGEQVDGDALLGAAAAHVEQRAVAAHQVHPLVVVHPAERRLRSRRAGRRRCCTGRSRASARSTTRSANSSSMHVASTSSSTKPVQLASAGQLVAVLVGVEADDARLEAQRQVLGDDGDVVALVRQVLRHGQDAVVVVVAGSAAGSPAVSWWLISTRSVPPVLVDRDRLA